MDVEALKVVLYRALPRSWQVRAVRLVTPNFTVGAMALVTDGGGRLVLTRTTYRAGWLPPGGFLQRHETPPEAVVRELREELGLTVTAAEPHRTYFDVRRQAVTFVCVVVVDPGVELVPRSAELAEARWFPLEDLPALPHDFHEGVPQEDVEAVRRASPVP